MSAERKPVGALEIFRADAREARYERERVCGVKASKEARDDSDTAIAAVAELIVSIAALVDPPLRYNDSRIEIDCPDHRTAMEIVGRVRKALAAVRGGAA